MSAMSAIAAELGSFALAYGARATLLLAAAAASVLLLRRNSAAARHAVWLAAFVAILALPAAMQFAPRIVVARAAIPDSKVLRSLVLADDNARINERSEHRDAVAPAPGGDAPSPPMIMSVPNRAVWSSEAVLMIVWLLGFGVCFARLSVGVWRARRLVRRARPVDVASPECRVRVLATDDIATPLTTGVIRPAVILPSNYGGWSAWELQSVVAHEAGHVERHDCLTQLLASVVCAIHWFNPLVWYAARAMRADAECACDDRVLRAAIPPVSYAELLVAFAKCATERRTLDAAFPMAAQGGELEHRIRCIVRADVRRGGCTRRHGVVVAVVAAACSVALTTPRLEAAVGSAASPISDARIARLHPVVPPMTPPSSRRSTVVAVRDTEPDDERIPLSADARQKARAASAALTGADSVFARRMFAALDREPLHDGDLVAERATWALAQADGARLIDPLIRALGSRDWRETAYAAWALGYSGNSRAVPLLIAALGHTAWRVRANASSALVALGDPRAAQAMHAALNDVAWQVRVEAVAFLGALGDVQSLAAIQPLLRDPHIAVRGRAEAALSERRQSPDQ